MYLDNTRLTWDHDGEWGVHGVDLTQLPPRDYAALYKLTAMESTIQRLNEGGLEDYEVESLAGDLRDCAPARSCRGPLC